MVLYNFDDKLVLNFFANPLQSTRDKMDSSHSTQFVIMFPIHNHFIDAFDFCLSYGISVFDFNIFGYESLVFNDPIDYLIFVGWANDRFLMIVSSL